MELNGKELQLGEQDSLPAMTGVTTPSGQIALAPASITFLAMGDAHNASCR